MVPTNASVGVFTRHVPIFILQQRVEGAKWLQIDAIAPFINEQLETAVYFRETSLSTFGNASNQQMATLGVCIATLLLIVNTCVVAMCSCWCLLHSCLNCGDFVVRICTHPPAQVLMSRLNSLGFL